MNRLGFLVDLFFHLLVAGFAFGTGLVVGMNHARSDEFRIGYGLGTKEALSADSTVKILSLTEIHDGLDPVMLKFEIGSFSDTSLEYPFTIYWSAQFGSRVEPFRWFYLENYFGPGWISQTSSKLGSNFQFFLDLGLGFREPNTGGTLGFGYQHLSNAGILQPNIGQNFMKVNVSWPMR